MSEVRESILNDDTTAGPTYLGSAYIKLYDKAFELAPTEVKGVIKREFYSVFTSLFGVLFQLPYLLYVMPSSSDSSSIKKHLHILVIIVGGAVVRTVIGYWTTGKSLEPKNTHVSKNASKTSFTKSPNDPSKKSDKKSDNTSDKSDKIIVETPTHVDDNSSITSKNPESTDDESSYDTCDEFETSTSSQSSNDSSDNA